MKENITFHRCKRALMNKWQVQEKHCRWNKQMNETWDRNFQLQSKEHRLLLYSSCGETSEKNSSGHDSFFACSHFRGRKTNLMATERPTVFQQRGKAEHEIQQQNQPKKGPHALDRSR